MSNSMPADKVAQWNYDGFLSPFTFLDAEELRACQEGVERYETWLGSRINDDAHKKWRSMVYLLMPWAAKLARDPRILDNVEALLGPDILIFTSTFFIKEANSSTIAAWHQDSTYYGLEPKDEVTVWVALTDASEAAGCMEALSFRGKPRQLSHVSHAVKDSVNRAGQIITEPLDELPCGNAAQARLVLDAPWPVPAPIGPQHFESPPHRPGTQLHPDQCQAVGFDPARGAARAWRRSPWAL